MIIEIPRLNIWNAVMILIVWVGGSVAIHVCPIRTSRRFAGLWLGSGGTGQ